MTQEEKARRYEEALERAKNFIENGDERERTIAESIFAGLMEESEDEKEKRIRKALMQNLKERFGTKGNMGEGLDMPDVLAWLEKQGQTFTKKDVNDAYLKGIYDTKHELEKQSEQKSAAWSEEDEKKRMLLISILEVNHPNGYFKVNPANTLNMEAMSVEELVDWLKSLKDRCTWKPSDEQMKALKYVLMNIPYNSYKQSIADLVEQLKAL